MILASHAMYYSFSAIYWREYNINLFQIGFLWFWGVLAEIIFFISIDRIKIKNIFFKAIMFVAVITTLRWMTILTILAGFSFNSFYNGVGFLIMAVFSFSSILIIHFRGNVLKNERR